MSVVAILLTMTVVPWTQIVAADPPQDQLLGIATVDTGSAVYYVVVCRNLVALDQADPVASIMEGMVVSDCTNSGLYMESNGVDGAQIYASPDAAFAGDSAVLPP